MNSKKASLTIIATMLFQTLTGLNLAYGQSYDGYGPRVDGLNHIYNPPQIGIIKNVLCKDLMNETLGALKYKACTDGIDAAHYMAEKYAANSGKYIGCVDGMNQGINDGYNSSVNPSQAMTSEAEKFVAGATFESARSRATEKAKAEAQTDSSKQLVERYRAVIGLTNPQTGKPILPNKDYQYPAITFNGFEDGYSVDVVTADSSYQNDMNQVYQLKWIDQNADEETKITARNIYKLNNSDGSSLCSLEQTIFGRTSLPRYSFWDYWRAQRYHDFKLYRWDNKDWAWDIFINDERTLSHYINFDQIPKNTKIIKVPVYKQELKLDANGNPIKVVDANGNPVLDANGRPTFVYIQVQVGTEDKVVTITADEANMLKNLYQTQFKVSYERDLANHYASVNYNKEGLEKYKIAKMLGTKIGEEVARYRAYRDAYNRKYKVESAKVYANTVYGLYEASFNRLLRIFESQSVYDLKNVSIIGEVQDNIFTPGENLSADITATNLGEVSKQASLYMSNTNDVIAAEDYIFKINPLTQARFFSPILGKINPGLLARDTVNVAVGITNPSDLAEIAKTLTSSKNQSLTLRNYIELDSIDSSLNLFTGELEVYAVVVNPAAIAMPVVADLMMTDNRTSTVTNVPIAQLPGGSSQRIILKAHHYDPLNLIDTQNLKVKIEAQLAGRVVSELSDTISITGNPVINKIEYFARLAAGLSTNSGNQSLDNRLIMLKDYIFTLIQSDVKNRVRWGKSKEFNRTALFIVLDQYLKLQRLGALSPTAQIYFDELAADMAKLAPTLKAKGWFNDKKHRRAFLKILKQISPSMN